MHVCAHEMSKLIALNCRMVFKAKLHLNSTHFLLHWSIKYKSNSSLLNTDRRSVLQTQCKA